MPRCSRIFMVAAAFALPALAPAYGQSGGSLLIWPLNPTIKAQENAAALWLENPSEQPITMQIQSFSWAQHDGEDVYAPQHEVIATPTLVTLAPKSRQLVRITRLGPPPSQAERAYRLIVDEVPVERKLDTDQQLVTGIQFRMRYSLPLFTYGAGMLPPSEAHIAGGDNKRTDSKNSNKGQYPTADLHWHLVQDGKQRVIEIENRGNGHARLTSAKITGPHGDIELASGLMGYVLAGSRLHYPLPDALQNGDGLFQLVASVNAADAAPLPKASP